MTDQTRPTGDGAPTTTQAWSFDRPAPAAEGRLTLGERDLPPLADGDVRVRVSACGLCRTDLHLLEGDLPVRRAGTVPGHQVVGRVVGLGAGVGAGVDAVAVGDRVGIAWLRRTCGVCRWCRTGRENLCPRSEYTGWDADGGLAGLAAVPAAYAYRLPEGPPDEQLAPLLCAGIIGYRALRRAALPPGGRLGIYGFGSSAHITAQLAMAEGAEVHVLTRGAGNRALAEELGAASVGAADASPPVRLDSAILFAPAGELVPVALAALDRGGTLAVAGIHLSDVPPLDYERHLFYERDLRSVTSNTRRDGTELLALARRAGVSGVRVHTTTYDFADTGRALQDLAAGLVSGSAVVVL
jgi:propanol-preferring alcohol dehydrogenase